MVGVSSGGFANEPLAMPGGAGWLAGWQFLVVGPVILVTVLEEITSFLLIVFDYEVVVVRLWYDIGSCGAECCCLTYIILFALWMVV